MLSLDTAVDALCWLTAISVLIQSAEYLRLPAAADDGRPSQHSGLLAPWPWAIQRDDLIGSSRPVRALFDRLYRPQVHRMQLFVHALCAASLPLIGPTPVAALVLLASQVLISIQALSSYFLSGTVKLLHAGWRDGRALPTLLDGGIHGPLAANSLLRRQPIAIICSWAFILWEAAFPLAMIDPRVTTLWCAIGVAFHSLVFWYFGLNRFFWAWCASFPALIGCAGLIGG